MSVDLIYRMQRSAPYAVDRDGFFFADSVISAIGALPFMFRERRGVTGAAKLFVKIAIRRCIYFGVARDGKPLSTGLLILGFCRYYAVPGDAIVIGEILTNPDCRGRGHATRAIMLAMNELMRRGPTTFYVDTQSPNLPMIRSIQKLGFGAPVGGTAAGSQA